MTTFTYQNTHNVKLSNTDGLAWCNLTCMIQSDLQHALRLMHKRLQGAIEKKTTTTYIMINKWNFLTLTKEQEDKKERLTDELSIDPYLAKLLVQRNVDTKEKAFDFFNPDLKNLHDPFLYPDMDLAVKRIERAIGNKERILIYGDYDVDGTTAVDRKSTRLNSSH